ncbi:hypothetical protein JVT61DRAFT_2033 [Boletus reticuloceps]|uniref:Uncharacterized protein n=1 Tax=Boletus reticuloceps TaxID=495285 RepID=A0A8I2YS89_9AGAM|nr:hypothetical protein JVT61DRAFT_2033 [Boletus reticuloceps]
MLFREANILYWAITLFKLAEDFVAKRLAKAPEPPPFSIHSIRFVDASLAFRYPPNSVKGRALSIDCGPR